MKNLKSIVTSLFIVFTLIINAQTTSGSLTYKVFRAGQKGFLVSSVLIQGKKDAVLIDAQFTRANAHRVVADIIESGKNLKAIYISQGDPDYYFGIGVITKTFPKAVVYATESTIEIIKKTYQKKLDVWGPQLGVNGPSNIIMPQALKTNSIDLEGHKLEIKGLDSPMPERTYVWIPSIKAIVGGVLVFDNLHLWMTDNKTKEQRKYWMNSLNEMEQLKPEVVIAGHALNDNNSKGTKSIMYSKEYLKTYEKEVKKAKNSKELIDAMKKRYPNAGLNISLEIGAKVVKGEMKW